MSKLWVEEIEGAALYADEAPSWMVSPQDKSTDIVAWDENGTIAKDYMFTQKQIASLVLAITGLPPSYPTYDNLTDDQKRIAAKWCVISYSKRVPDQYSDDEDKENWRKLVDRTYGFPKDKLEGRARRIYEIQEYISECVRIEVMTVDQAKDFYESVRIEVDLYLRSDNINFYNWINNLEGYSTDGFEQKAYYDSDVRDRINEIYNGDY